MAGIINTCGLANETASVVRTNIPTMGKRNFILGSR
jgi:hypothetical protein